MDAIRRGTRTRTPGVFMVKVQRVCEPERCAANSAASSGGAGTAGEGLREQSRSWIWSFFRLLELICPCAEAPPPINNAAISGAAGKKTGSRRQLPFIPALFDSGSVKVKVGEETPAQEPLPPHNQQLRKRRLFNHPRLVSVAKAALACAH